MNRARESAKRPKDGAPCSRCLATGSEWDWLGDHVLCSNCLEKLAIGEGEPLSIGTHPDFCVVCGKIGTVPYLTLPIRSRQYLELRLCPDHFRTYLARCLGVAEFRALAKSLGRIGLAPTKIFLLHECFYDSDGRAINPAGGESWDCGSGDVPEGV